MNAAPPRPPSYDELEALIREARARQKKRWLGVAAVIVLLAGAGLAAFSIAGGRTAGTTHTRGSTTTTMTGKCGVRVMQTEIRDRSGHVVYREPVRRTFGHQIQCSGASTWVIFFNGVASSQQAYFGVHSGDSGRTWRVVFTERYFGMKAPHQLDSYMGPWTLSRGAAYFLGLCPACGRQPTVSLWVTKTGGRTFRRYDIDRLDGYWPTTIRVAGGNVSIAADRPGRGRTTTVHVA